MQFNGPVSSGHEQDHQPMRICGTALEMDAENTTSPAGPSRGEQLDRRLARDRVLREIHSKELQIQLNGAHWLETHARTACVVGGLISLPLWISMGPAPGLPTLPGWLIMPTVSLAAVVLSLGSICATGAWSWRKWTLWRATVRCLEVRDPAQPLYPQPID